MIMPTFHYYLSLTILWTVVGALTVSLLDAERSVDAECWHHMPTKALSNVASAC